MGLLQGKNALILGVANDHSIAWAIAQVFQREGARLALTFPGDSIERRVRPLAESIGCTDVLRCDVASDADLDALSRDLQTRWGRVDVVVHSVAFAPREALRGRFVDTTRDDFRVALDVSAYSLVALVRALDPILPDGASILTLSYLGAERVMPGYNVMGVAKAALEASVRYLSWDLGSRGVRINAISAGPLRTLSSAGVAGFKTMLHHHAEKAPLRRNISQAEVAETAAFLASGRAGGITGEVVHVDAGYSVMGL